MNSKKFGFLMMALAIVFLSVSPALPGGASAALAETNPQPEAAVTAVSSPYDTTPPVLDGNLVSGEWNSAGQFPFHDGTITINNDSTRLYVLLDVTNATPRTPTITST